MIVFYHVIAQSFVIVYLGRLGIDQWWLADQQHTRRRSRFVNQLRACTYTHCHTCNSLITGFIMFLITGFIQMIFVIASFCNFLGPLVLGIVLDSYGPRVCSVLSILLITIGSAMFAISDANSLPLFVPGMCLIAFGGPGTQNAIIHLSNLFPEWKATATSFIVGSFQLSFVVFLVFDQLWSHLKYSYTTLFTGYCLVCVANVAISLVMWPDEPYHVEEPAETAQPAQSRPQSQEMSRIRLPSVMMSKSRSRAIVQVRQCACVLAVMCDKQSRSCCATGVVLV